MRLGIRASLLAVIVSSMLFSLVVLTACIIKHRFVLRSWKILDECKKFFRERTDGGGVVVSNSRLANGITGARLYFTSVIKRISGTLTYPSRPAAEPSCGKNVKPGCGSVPKKAASAPELRPCPRLFRAGSTGNRHSPQASGSGPGRAGSLWLERGLAHFKS